MLYWKREGGSCQIDTTMNNTYLHTLEKLLRQVRPDSFLLHQLEFKDCFGAVAGYVDSHLFISCGKFGVALKLPPETLTELFREEDVSHLRYFPKGHVKKEYAVLSQRIIDDQERFKKLVDKSIHYALSILP